MDIETSIEKYLDKTKTSYDIGQPEYYGRIALEQALAAHNSGNYGIGAVAINVTTDLVSEFPARNAMFEGVGVVDHAETRALLDIRKGIDPSSQYGTDTNPLR